VVYAEPTQTTPEPPPLPNGGPQRKRAMATERAHADENMKTA